MRGGNLTRYHPPLIHGQYRSGVTEELIKIASPVFMNAMQSGLQAAASGRSFGDVEGVVGESLKRGLKRNVGSLVKLYLQLYLQCDKTVGQSLTSWLWRMVT